jgi:multidrug resistance protein, MATE family
MGHMATPAYLGAVAIGALIFDYLYWGFGFLRLSTTGLAAQALGRGDPIEARAVLGRAGLIALIGAGGLWIAHPFIFSLAHHLIEASPEVEAFAQVYFDIRIWSAPAALLNYALMGWLLAHKNTKAVLIQQVFINVLNVGLDLWFVWGLGFDVDGVAYATLIAQYGGLLCGLWFVKGHFVSKWSWGDIINLSALKSMMAMNLDLFVRTICLLSAFAWFTAQGAKLGDVVLAANAILLQFQQFTAYALDGFAHAVEILSAHACGKKDREEFRRVVKQSSIMAGLTALCFVLIYWVFGDLIIQVFTDITTVQTYAQSYLGWVILLPLISVWSFQLDGIYFGLTQTHVLRNMMVLSLIIYLPLSLWCLEQYDNHGLWAAFTFFMGLRAITLISTFPAVQKKVFG